MNDPLQITVTINAPELSHAILELAGVLTMLVSAETGLLSLKHHATAQDLAQQASQQVAQATAAQAAAAQGAPLAQPAPVQAPTWEQYPTAPPAPAYPPLHLASPPVPVQPPAPVQQPAAASVQQPAAAPVAAPVAPVPTAVQGYTQDQLAVAATQLVDQGRRVELVGLLNAFGVPALTALPREQYGNFATQLRAMGAKL